MLKTIPQTQFKFCKYFFLPITAVVIYLVQDLELNGGFQLLKGINPQTSVIAGCSEEVIMTESQVNDLKMAKEKKMVKIRDQNKQIKQITFPFVTWHWQAAQASQKWFKNRNLIPNVVTNSSLTSGIHSHLQMGMLLDESMPSGEAYPETSRKIADMCYD